MELHKKDAPLHPSYYVGLGIPGSDLHVTLAYCGELNHIAIENIRRSMEELTELWSRKQNISITVNEEAFFGPNNDIHVMLVSLGPNEFVKKSKQFWLRYNVKQEHTKNLTSPNYHITKKNDKDNILVKDAVFEGNKIFLKRIGRSPSTEGASPQRGSDISFVKN